MSGSKFEVRVPVEDGELSVATMFEVGEVFLFATASRQSPAKSVGELLAEAGAAT